MNTIPKHKAVSIALDWSDGVYSFDGPGCWIAADDQLRIWALTEDGAIGYAKVNFTVTYDDGETYSGRYDLRYHDRNFRALIKRHMTWWLTWHAGLETDPWCGIPKYRKMLDRRDLIAESRRWLDTYEIGDAGEAETWPTPYPTREAAWTLPVYVPRPGRPGKRVLSKYVNVCTPHLEKREDAGEVGTPPSAYREGSFDNGCTDCKAGDLIPGPGRRYAQQEGLVPIGST